MYENSSITKATTTTTTTTTTNNNNNNDNNNYIKTITTQQANQECTVMVYLTKPHSYKNIQTLIHTYNTTFRKLQQIESVTVLKYHCSSFNLNHCVLAFKCFIQLYGVYSTLRCRPHLAGYFRKRIFLSRNTATVHT